MYVKETKKYNHYKARDAVRALHEKNRRAKQTSRSNSLAHRASDLLATFMAQMSNWQRHQYMKFISAGGQATLERVQHYAQLVKP